MKVIVYERIFRGFNAVHRDLPPAEVKKLRRELKAKLAALQSQHPGQSNYQLTDFGDFIWGHCSGTRSELTEAGICTCLGRDKDCKRCDGTGEWDEPLDYQI